MKQLLKRLVQALGFDIVSYPYFSDKQRLALFQRFGIGTIVDIGANEGQYARHIWDIGFDGTIISFEPIQATFDKLNAKDSKGRRWIKKNLAVGLKDEEALINVTENTLSSSLLPPLETFLETTPEAKVLRK